MIGDQSYIGFDTRPQVNRDLSEQLKINLAYSLAYAQADGSSSRWLGMADPDSRTIDLLSQDILEMPHALIAEPDSSRLILGFPAGAGLLLATDDTNRTWGNSAANTSTFQGWLSKLNMSDPLFSQDPRFSEELVDRYNLSYGPDYNADLNAALELEDGSAPEWMQDAAFSNIAVQVPLFPNIMSNSPIQIRWMRGAADIDAVYDDDGRIIDGSLDLLRLDAYVQIFQETFDGDPDTQATLFKAGMAMEFDPQGSLYLAADGVNVALLSDQAEMDADMRVLFDASLGYGIEGGVTLYDMQTPGVQVDKAAAVAGFTLIPGGTPQIGLLYVGATLDARVQLEGIGRIDLGGSFLYGRLDAGSPVLADEYGDLFADMQARPARSSRAATFWPTPTTSRSSIWAQAASACRSAAAANLRSGPSTKPEPAIPPGARASA